jgi:leucyl-tRNA synthetase
MVEDRYNHSDIEKKWQKRWAEEGVFTTPDVPTKPKAYVLDMFPYPSGEGLHVGHPKGYIATDVYSRMKMAQGYSVLHPMGWDAFGLPAENYAIKNKVHPRVAVEKNIARFKQQLSKIGFTYDWSREVNTTDPDYYKWTQWIFLQLYKKGLAYESFEPINWCPSCQTGLANEDLDQGKCERCGSVVEKRPMRQWMLKITDYAEKLLQGLPDLPWPEYIKESQRNWIGRKEGINISYDIVGSSEHVVCFTTRPDTNFGATFIVIGPENSLASRITIDAQKNEVEQYIAIALQKTEIDRLAEDKKKTGVFTGAYCINQLTQEKLPIYISDYVLGNVGTGAVVGVPGHDKRDFEFAQQFNIPVKRVVAINGDESEITSLDQVQEDDGIMINSGFLDGMNIHDATEKIMDYIENEGYGKRVIDYKLRDWVFSRQRYWGEPIPLIHCEPCGVVPVPEDQLPVLLPEVEKYEPTGTGESPLANIADWVNVACPKCGGSAKRETNTMPQWAGSSWYYLRFIDPKNSTRFVDQVKEKAWMPVDVYVGGAEHATRHLIYARFWHIALHELGYVSTKEPFMHLENVGLILAEDGRKMSKRWGNVVNPDDIVATVGADTLRIYEMFMGPFNQATAWSTAGMQGPRRFIERIWKLVLSNIDSEEDASELVSKLHQTIKRVTDDTQNFRFNTAIAALMELLNMCESQKSVSRSSLEVFLQLLAPYAPHVSEELWERMGHTGRIVVHPWPVFDAVLATEATVSIAVQINGKVRGEVQIASDASQEDVEAAARVLPNVAKNLEGKEVQKVIYIPNRLISFVAK